ncbi:MAG: universal stress protein [Acidobacteriia bacterium]|nr:universal stress protein [Terriglobia bacterium]
MPSITRILVPVDFSPPAEGAARYAQSIARHIGCKLTLLHVLEPSAFAFSPVEVSAERMGELMAGRSRAAQAELNRLPDGQMNGDSVKRLLVRGDPAEQILLCALSEKADLIVMPTHGYDPIRRFLLGSVASKVLHGANIPMLTGVHFEEHATGTFPPRHIVCGLDLGPHSAPVLEWAWHMAQEFTAPLTVVHATSDIGGRTEDFIHPDWRAMLNNRVREQIASLQQAAVEKADVVVAAGDPHKVLSDTVERMKADLLVIGRGASAAGPFGRLRAHAYAIVRASPCPVLSV